MMKLQFSVVLSFDTSRHWVAAVWHLPTRCPGPCCPFCRCCSHQKNKDSITQISRNPWLLSRNTKMRFHLSWTASQSPRAGWRTKNVQAPELLAFCLALRPRPPLVSTMACATHTASALWTAQRLAGAATLWDKNCISPGQTRNPKLPWKDGICDFLEDHRHNLGWHLGQWATVLCMWDQLGPRCEALE